MCSSFECFHTVKLLTFCLCVCQILSCLIYSCVSCTSLSFLCFSSNLCVCLYLPSASSLCSARTGGLAEREGGQELSVGEWVNTLGILSFSFLTGLLFISFLHLVSVLALYGIHTSAAISVFLSSFISLPLFVSSNNPKHVAA